VDQSVAESFSKGPIRILRMVLAMVLGCREIGDHRNMSSEEGVISPEVVKKMPPRVEVFP